MNWSLATVAPSLLSHGVHGVSCLCIPVCSVLLLSPHWLCLSAHDFSLPPFGFILLNSYTTVFFSSCSCHHLTNSFSPCSNSSFFRHGIWLIQPLFYFILFYFLLRKISPELTSVPVFLHFICGSLPEHGWWVVYVHVQNLNLWTQAAEAECAKLRK